MIRKHKVWLFMGLALAFSLFLSAGAPLQAAATDLLITGVIDGPITGGLPKGVEVYVVNDIPDLSIYGIGSANNGGGTDGEEFTFPVVSATAGDFIYVASEAVEFANWFGFSPDYTDSAANVNGDDAIELFESGTVIDTFGDIDTDGSGEPWEYLDGWAYRVGGTDADGST
ncbi:MAG: nuclease, partial [Chloroflexi bacterium]|nr:nuclease [Chloroflexota bacterium]